MLNHEIDYLIGSMSSLYPTFETDVTITISDTIVGVDYNYLKLNNKRINATWRKAISYAIDYTYIIEELMGGKCVRANSTIAPAFFGYDSSVKAPDYNLTHAREIVGGMGYGNLSWTDTQWEDATFVTLNYTYNVGNSFKEDLGVLLLENLNHIGIAVVDQGMSWADFGTHPPMAFKDYRELYWMYRVPDYLDPMNMFLPVLSNQSIPDNWEDIGANFALVNDSWLEQKFTQALKETNDTARAIIYSEIQHYLTEELFPHAFGFHSKLYYVHSADLRNVPYNSFGAFYAWPIYRD